MWLALLAMLVALVLGLLVGVSVSTAQAPYLGLVILVLLEGGIRILRQNLAGRYNSRGFVYYLLSTLVVVLGLAWLGEQLSLGRVGGVPSLTLAVEIVLAARIFGYADDIRAALMQPSEVPSPYETHSLGGEAEETTRKGRLA